MAPDKGQLIAAILNDAWMVRHYQRGGRAGGIALLRRQQAIIKLAATCRHAFNACCENDLEAVLTAIVDGLRPIERPPF